MNKNIAIKAYEELDQETGEVKRKVKYLVGNPRQYRFNGQSGRFNINGDKDIGTSLDIVPMAWRVFKAQLFGRNRRETWAELFFIDKENCLSSLMFNNTSVQILQNTFGQVIYDGLLLDQVKLRITSERRTNEKVKASYYIAKFFIDKAEDDLLILNKEFAADFLIYRGDTITEDEMVTLSSFTYRTPDLVGEILD